MSFCLLSVYFDLSKFIRPNIKYLTKSAESDEPPNELVETNKQNSFSIGLFLMVSSVSRFPSQRRKVALHCREVKESWDRVLTWGERRGKQVTSLSISQSLDSYQETREAKQNNMLYIHCNRYHQYYELSSEDLDLTWLWTSSICFAIIMGIFHQFWAHLILGCSG